MAARQAKTKYQQLGAVEQYLLFRFVVNKSRIRVTEEELVGLLRERANRAKRVTKRALRKGASAWRAKMEGCETLTLGPPRVRELKPLAPKRTPTQWAKVWMKPGS